MTLARARATTRISGESNRDRVVVVCKTRRMLRFVTAGTHARGAIVSIPPANLAPQWTCATMDLRHRARRAPAPRWIAAGSTGRVRNACCAGATALRRVCVHICFWCRQMHDCPAGLYFLGMGGCGRRRPPVCGRDGTLTDGGCTPCVASRPGARAPWHRQAQVPVDTGEIAAVPCGAMCVC